jgi:hypothetical protein
MLKSREIDVKTVLWPTRTGGTSRSTTHEVIYTPIKSDATRTVAVSGRSTPTSVPLQDVQRTVCSGTSGGAGT